MSTTREEEAKDIVIEDFGVPEIFVDGFMNHIARDGVMSCIGYRQMPRGKTVVVRLVWPVINTTAAIDEANAAMGGKPAPQNGSKAGVH